MCARVRACVRACVRAHSGIKVDVDRIPADINEQTDQTQFDDGVCDRNVNPP